MLQDDLRNFVGNIYKYLIAEEYIPRLLVKKHSENLLTQGDFSFPNTAKSWQDFLNCEALQRSDGTLLKCVNKDIIDLINVSQDWVIPVVKAIELKQRVHLFLCRDKAVRMGFVTALSNNDIIIQRINRDTTCISADPLCTESKCITFLRLQLLTSVIKKMYLINVYPEIIDVLVTWKSNYKDDNVRSIFCGTVLNAKTGVKENTITAEEYVRLRQNELTLIAQHKYGVRVSTETLWKKFIAHLGESAVAFELLQTKCSSPVKIQFNISGGSSKGAAFILYNCARLETIIRTFNQKVTEGTYPPLPKLEETELSLLSDEDEWSLIFNYILGFPSLLKTSVEISMEKCEFRPHLICNFLSSMVKDFSQYYRRVRILTEPRKHLMPVMFARIHMLIILNNTLKLCLSILNIKSVSQMYRRFYFLLNLLRSVSFFFSVAIDDVTI